MKNKGKIILSIVGVVLSIALLVVSTILAEEKIINPATAIIFIAVSVILVWIAISYAAKVDYETGVMNAESADIHSNRPSGHIFWVCIH